MPIGVQLRYIADVARLGLVVGVLLVEADVLVGRGVPPAVVHIGTHQLARCLILFDNRGEGDHLVAVQHGLVVHAALAGVLDDAVVVGAGLGISQAAGVLEGAGDVVRLVEVDHAELVVSSGGDELALSVVVVRHLNELEGELARLDGAALEVLDDLRIDVAHLIDRLAAGRIHAVAGSADQIVGVGVVERRAFTFRQNQRVQRGVEVVSVAAQGSGGGELSRIVVVNRHGHFDDIGRRVLGGIVAIFGHQIVMVADVVALVLALSFSNIGDGGELYGRLASRELILGDASDQRGKLLVLKVFFNSYGRNRFTLTGDTLDLNQGEAAVARLT